MFKVSIIDRNMYSLFVLFIDSVSFSSCHNTYHGNATWGINDQTQIHAGHEIAFFLTYVHLIKSRPLSIFASDISLCKVYIHY